MNSQLTSERRTIDGEPTVAVTGAAGYTGSRVLARLQDEHPEWNLVGLDNQYLGQVESVGDTNIEHVDIRDRHRVESLLEGVDVVFHLAAISGVDDCENNPELAYEVNVTGTNNIAWFCRKNGAALTFPFSMAVLGDPERFPITGDLERAPLNWYGETKHLGERAIESFAENSFPAHTLMISNLYGEHTVGETIVSKPTVINFFLKRALSGQELTVYEPGTQARNFVHVKDVATAYLRSAERLLEQLHDGVTGTETYEIASREDPSVLKIAKSVREIADEFGVDVDITLVENPRSGETMVDDFGVDTSSAQENLNWTPTHTVEEAIRDKFGRNR